MPTKKRAVCSIEVFDEGQGDPVWNLFGGHPLRAVGFHDIMVDAGLRGTFNRTTDGWTKLEVLPEIGLTNRAFLVLKDTRLTQYSTSGGTWEEFRPTDGNRSVYRICQVATTSGVQYSAESSAALPDNVPFAVEVLLPPTPSAWDRVTYPPYTRVEWGGSSWALHWQDGAGVLLRKVSGSWVPVMELPSPPRNAGGHDQETVVAWVRPLRGGIGISLDYGRNYAWYGGPASPVSSPGGKVRFSGQGGFAAFGLHQLQLVTGTWDAETRSTFGSRTGSPTFASRKDEPGGATCAVTDLSSLASGLASYRATLTPGTASSAFFTCWRAPVLYAVTTLFPASYTATANTTTTPWDSRLVSASVTAGEKLAEVSANWTVRLDPGSTWDENWRWRKVRIKMGWLLSDGTFTWWTVFTGYVRDHNQRRDDYGSIFVDFAAEGIACRLGAQGVEWTQVDVVPLSAFTSVNTAADHILSTEAMDSSYRTWDGRGMVAMPPGSVEEPFELLRPAEGKLETAERLFGHIGLELGDDLDGGFFTVPQDYYGATVHHLDPTGTTLETAVERIGQRTDYSEGCTAVFVSGRSEGGQAILQGAVDFGAETSLASGRFSPFRQVRQEEMPDTCSPAWAQLRANALAWKGFPVRDRGEMALPLNGAILRRDQVETDDAGEVGIPDATRQMVLSTKHDWSISDDGEAVGATTLSLLPITW